jgi:hypothetical protein
MTVTSGQRCSGLYKNASPVGCLVKTLLESSTWDSKIVYLTWNGKATKSNRLLFQLAPSTPRTDEIGCGLLPTPRAKGAETYETRAKRKGHKMAMSYLESAVGHPDFYKMLPTPSARDYKGARKPDTMEATGRNADTNSLPDALEFKDGTNRRLSPLFVEWMMGYPIDHTALKD